jgi:tRNA(Ile)-lysidine synthase
LARYGLIRDYMGADNIGLLLTAHTRDDVAETLLMRLARGSGVDGLAAMAPRLRLSDLGLAGPADRFDPEIARPLLDTSKARLRATLEARGIPWIEDPSNQSPAFERSRLRAAQAGLDALGLNHAMLALSAKRLLRARRALEQIVDQFCAPAGGAVSVDPSGYFVIDLAKLQAAEAEIAVRVLARVVAVAGGSGEPVPLGKLEAVADALRRTKSEHPATTLARALITAKGGAVFVEREPGREPLPRILVGPGKQVCWDGRFLVGVGPDPAVGTVEVRPLGQAALAALRRQDVLATRVSAAVTIPSFWRGETLIAAPSIGYWAAAELRRMLYAEFVGLPLGNRTSASP